jgi:hypothetical protein
MVRKYIYYVFWIIGAALLMYLSTKFIDYAKTQSMQSYNTRYAVWATAIVSFVSGIYLGFLSGIPKRFQLHFGKFLVFILSFLALSYYLTLLYFEVKYLPFYLKAMQYHGYFFTGVISGCSLVLGLFKFKER